MRMRTVVVLAYPGCQVLDVTGPAEVFSVAGALADANAYNVVVTSADGADVVSSSGVRLGVASAIADVEDPVDTVVIPGGFSWPQAMEDATLLAEIRAITARGRRVMAVCAGAFLAGATGLLDG